MDQAEEKPKRRLALISVSDKKGVVELAQGLVALGWEILSTGGTARYLREGGIPVIEVSEFTGFPECLDGRVKTLHPKIFAGILAMDTPEHQATLAELNYQTIGLVVVNLYPFEQTIAKPGVSDEEAIENIDIGGPSMLRAAAKNFEYTTVIVDPGDYGVALGMLRQGGKILPLRIRLLFALKVFQTTALYDSAISAYLAAKALKPPTEHLHS